ncbi:hypothetical protein MJG53_010992 [Ovis ammon polii x Ovis aries]|uniref:Uncharacterized protein n=1 Tax=Ovis ammon polii x Ovis aries TaxID=2918886 RepID=A0ACB9US86_9CETA|nr:hypothetical protein MJG53_010992 [Ovis ammon polii x Ovis aries]
MAAHHRMQLLFDLQHRERVVASGHPVAAAPPVLCGFQPGGAGRVSRVTSCFYKFFVLAECICAIENCIISIENFRIDEDVCVSFQRLKILALALAPQAEATELGETSQPGCLVLCTIRRHHQVGNPPDSSDCRIPQIEDAEIHNKTYRHGDKLIITCHEGFKIRYPDLYNVVSLCRDDGTWDNLPICQGCLRPLASSNGYVNISEFQTSFPVGTVISYHCFPGFKLEGSEYLECLHNLIWSSSPPRCLALEVKALSGDLIIGSLLFLPGGPAEKSRIFSYSGQFLLR